MSMIDPIRASFEFTDSTFNYFALPDLTNEDAVWRLREGEGASISWTVGHLYDYRCIAMNLLGREKERGFKKLFNEESASDGNDYPDISELREMWKKLADELQDVLADVTDEQLLAPAFPGTGNKRTVMDAFIFYMWHEAYHVGTIGTIRKERGYPAISELAVRAAHASKESAQS